jgi:hypothetical protein
MNEMKEALGDFHNRLEEQSVMREENHSDILNSIKQINVYVRTQFNNEAEDRQKFEENVFSIMEETTKQLSLIK